MNPISFPRARLKTVFELLLALALLFTTAVTPAAAASKCADTHTVEARETIWRLVKEYGVPAARIAQANGLKRPYNLKIGQQLCIPYRPAGSLGDSAVVDMTHSGDSLTISGAGFPKLHAFRVKVQNAGTWTVLAGDLRADRNGAIARTRYKLPAELKGKPVLQVCLKDLATDAMSCYMLLPQSQ